MLTISPCVYIQISPPIYIPTSIHAYTDRYIHTHRGISACASFTTFTFVRCSSSLVSEEPPGLPDA